MVLARTVRKTVPLVIVQRALPTGLHVSEGNLSETELLEQRAAIAATVGA
jgi:hypothetical protein